MTLHPLRALGNLSGLGPTSRGRFSQEMLIDDRAPCGCRDGFMKSCFLTYETSPSKVMP